MSIRGSKTAPQSGSKTAPRYARVPTSVIHDVMLGAASIAVFSEMALWVFQGTTCSIGQRAIAKRLGLSRNTVSEAIKNLVERGHVEMCRPESRGRRPVYVLTSQIYGQKQGKESVVVSSPSGGRRFASIDREEVA